MKIALALLILPSLALAGWQADCRHQMHACRTTHAAVAVTAPTLPPDRQVQTPGGWKDCLIVSGIEYCPYPDDQPTEVPAVFTDGQGRRCVTVRIGPDGVANLYGIGTLETLCQAP